MAELILVRGYPGQGKTTFANTVFPNILHLENDMFFMSNGKYNYNKAKMSQAIDWCFSNVERYLKDGIDCVVSNTFTRRRFVESYRSLAEVHGASFRVYRMMGDFKNVHDDPEDVLRNMKERFEDYPGETLAYPNVDNSGYVFERPLTNPFERDIIMTKAKQGRMT